MPDLLCLLCIAVRQVPHVPRHRVGPSAQPHIYGKHVECCGCWCVWQYLWFGHRHQLFLVFHLRVSAHDHYTAYMLAEPCSDFHRSEVSEWRSKPECFWRSRRLYVSKRVTMMCKIGIVWRITRHGDWTDLREKKITEICIAAEDSMERNYCQQYVGCISNCLLCFWMCHILLSNIEHFAVEVTKVRKVLVSEWARLVEFWRRLELWSTTFNNCTVFFNYVATFGRHILLAFPFLTSHVMKLHVSNQVSNCN